MRIVKTESELVFVADSSDTEADQAFSKRMEQYKLVQQGASIYIYKLGKLLSHYNPFDNTQLVCSAEGFELANEFGAKRFLILEARAALTAAGTATAFSRDRSFPLKATANDASNPFKVAGLKELLDLNQQNKEKVYNDLADLLDGCADFTPDKQAEYKRGGSIQDKFCRFNLENQQPKDGMRNEQVFLLDEKNKIMGSISATICTNANGDADIYVYDEVVDYKAQAGSDPAAERLKLMGFLFAALREQIRKTLCTLITSLSEANLDQKIETASVRALIRAAAENISTYVQLGCGSENTGYYVIHGPATPAAKLLDSYLKETWAQEKLQQLALKSPTQTNTSSNLFYHGHDVSETSGDHKPAATLTR